MAAFTGPALQGAPRAKSDPPEILPPEERKAAMSTLDPIGGQMDPGGA